MFAKRFVCVCLGLFVCSAVACSKPSTVVIEDAKPLMTAEEAVDYDKAEQEALQQQMKDAN